jgi:hypothetical protein
MSADGEQAIYSAAPGEVARHRDTVLSIWSGSLGQQDAMREKFDWFYQHCPFGEPLLVLLTYQPEGSHIGAAAIGPRRMLWQSQEIEAGVLVDLAVSNAHRSLGPALMLERALSEFGIARFQLIYGFPNTKATAVFKRIGYYDKLGDMIRYAYVLRFVDYAARRLPRMLAVPAGWLLGALRNLRDVLRLTAYPQWVACWGDVDDPRIDALWQRSQKPAGLFAIRNRSFLRWRFADSPRPARLLFICDKNDQRLLTWFACEANKNVLHIRDYWTLQSSTGIPSAHFSLLFRTAYAEGYSSISFEYCGAQATHERWKAAGFIERGHRPVYGRHRIENVREIRTDDLHLTSADEDE